MVRDVKLISYLPQFIQDYREIKEILKSEDPEIFSLNNEIENLRNNQFILTCDEVGIGRFEKLLKITPYSEDSLNARISRVLTRWNDSIPYTYKGLINKLNTICGESNYILIPNFNGIHCTKYIDLHLINPFLYRIIETEPQEKSIFKGFCFYFVTNINQN